jgi:hypothetical protein
LGDFDSGSPQIWGVRGATNISGSWSTFLFVKLASSILKRGELGKLPMTVAPIAHITIEIENNYDESKIS